MLTQLRRCSWAPNEGARQVFILFSLGLGWLAVNFLQERLPHSRDCVQNENVCPVFPIARERSVVKEPRIYNALPPLVALAVCPRVSDLLFSAVLSKEKCNNSVTSVDLLFLFILFCASATCQHGSISLAGRLRGISQFLFPGLEAQVRPRKVGRGKSKPPPPRGTWVWRAQPHDRVLRDVHRPHRSLWSPGAWVLAQKEHVLGTLFCKLLDPCLVPCLGCCVQEVEPGISPLPVHTKQVRRPMSSLLTGRYLPQGWVCSPEALDPGPRPVKTWCCFLRAMRTASAASWPHVCVRPSLDPDPGPSSARGMIVLLGQGVERERLGGRPGCQGQRNGEPRTFPEEGQEQGQAGSRVVQGSKPPEQVLVFHQTAHVTQPPRIQSSRSPCAGHRASSLVIGPPKHGPHASVLCPRSGPGVDFCTSRVQNPWEGLSPLA